MTVDALKQAIVRYTSQHAGADGLALTPIPGLRMMCARAPSGSLHFIYKPLVCLVLQSAKQMTIGTETSEFAAGQSVILGLDAPVTGRIVRASKDEPYIALAIELDLVAIRELAMEMDPMDPPAPADESTLWVGSTDAPVLDCGIRLMRLLDRPEAVPILRPVIMKELHYWLLRGEHGAAIRRIAMPNGEPQRLAAAVKLLRAKFHEPLKVEQLAAIARMSTSTFHLCTGKQD